MSKSTVCGTPSCSLLSTTVCSNSSLSISFRCDSAGSKAGDKVKVKRKRADSTNSSRRTLTPMLPSPSKPRSVSGLPKPMFLKLLVHSRSASKSAPASCTATTGARTALSLTPTAAAAVFLLLEDLPLALASGATAKPQAKSTASQGLAVNTVGVITQYSLEHTEAT